MFRYAQINDDNICISDTQASDKIEQDNMILLTDNEPSPLNKVYDKGEWKEQEPK